jgi:DNA-directed RNA polymerase specialized sigma24 family protein
MNSENSGRAGTGSHEAAESGAFALTDWDAVWEVEQPGARGARALERLCSAYWRPLVNHLLRSGIQPADAEDLVQGFFVDFLQKRGFSRARREDGKLRTFLLRSLEHHAAAVRRRAEAGKRGGDRVQVEATEAELAVEPGQAAAFDLDWAVALKNAALETVRQEAAKDENGQALWEELKSLVPLHEAPHNACAEVAKRLRMNKNTVRSRLARLREAYTYALINEAAHTLRAKALRAVEGELRALGLLSGPS